jgi:TonB family protein
MNSCLNCGATLMDGATVCPVCRQPVGLPQRESNWQQQQPTVPLGAPWQQPPYGPPPPRGSNASRNLIWLVVIGFLLLVIVGGMVGTFVYLKSRIASVAEDNENYNRRERASPTPDKSIADQTTAPVPPPPRPPGKSNPPISGGVLNGKAISLPKPAYPAIARSARASGTVTVQVTVDESGKVTSARAISGHPLLQASAVQAAYGARFSPTLLSGQPVKVTGVLTYNFTLEQ